ncbi:MAG TPA: DUF2235 domain-containing protein, partial [Casimicrobiaceae bacterium]|nr:DUF2235 domain-containing protein [Casimicrobiaceae bacterium]
ICMARPCPLPPYSLEELEPLVVHPDAAAPIKLRPSPRPSQLEALFGQATVEHNVQELSADLGRRKRIVICADGTWNTPKTKKGEDTSTNVWRMYELVKHRAADGTPQLKYYHAGVGTTGSKLDRIIDGASGRGLTANMKDCYDFLVRYYRPGDSIYLFGFSRGAYTARSLGGIIRNCGIVNPDKEKSKTLSRAELLKRAYALYRNRDPDTLPVASRAVQFRADYAHPDFQIACIGVWDTVGALGIPVEHALTTPIRWFNESVSQFHDVTLSSYVDCAFHALALNERREAFKPTLWVQQPHAKAAGQVMEQVWFAGVHSDVGGGYAVSERGLANVTLRWMVNRVSDTCGLELDLMPLAKQEAQPSEFFVHDSMSWLYQLGNALHLSRPFQRVVDGGLRPGGVRDAERVVTEWLHDSVERFAAKATPTPIFDLANVRDYQSRLAESSGDPVPPPAQVDRRKARLTAEQIDLVRLERRDASGRVVTSLMLKSDGRAEHQRDATTVRVGSMAVADFLVVAQRIIDSDFFTLADLYDSPLGRREAIVVHIESGRRRKTVVSYDRFGPARLDDVTRAIDAMQRHVDWDV